MEGCKRVVVSNEGTDAGKAGIPLFFEVCIRKIYVSGGRE